MTLHIDLQDGFQNDAVVIRVDGKQVYSKQDVSTDARISRADALEAQASSNEVTVDVELPKKHIHASQKVRPGTTPNVGISLNDGKPEFRVQSEVFRYM